MSRRYAAWQARKHVETISGFPVALGQGLLDPLRADCESSAHLWHVPCEVGLDIRGGRSDHLDRGSRKAVWHRVSAPVMDGHIPAACGWRMNVHRGRIWPEKRNTPGLPDAERCRNCLLVA